MKKYIALCLTFFFLSFSICAKAPLLLKDNLQKAHPGDFIVTAQGKNYNLLHIVAKTPANLTIEEISIPAAKIPKQDFSWKNWLNQGAQSSTSRVAYHIDTHSGAMRNFYVLKQGVWHEASLQSNFLSTLLNLPFQHVPLEQRRRVGRSVRTGANDRRPLWQPKLIVDGQTIEGIRFNAWQTVWPKDGTDLAGKSIEVYLPEEGSNYPSYFPYWLQISGLVGNAKIRIVDSGMGLIASHSLPQSETGL